MTCVPPLDVQILLTNETCLVYPSDIETTTCHLSLSISLSLIFGRFDSELKYIFTYFKKEFISIYLLFNITFTFGINPAMS